MKSSLINTITNFRYNIKNNQVTVLYCDIQNNYINKMYLSEMFYKSCLNIANISNIFKFNNYVTEHVPKVFGKTNKDLLNLISNPIIKEKNKFAMFDDDDLNNYLIQKNSDSHTFILIGMEAHICVFQTAFNLLNFKCKSDSKNFMIDVIIVKDAVSSNCKNERKLAIENLSDMGCFVTSIQNLLYLILEDSKHEKFKESLPLMKKIMELDNQLV